jgi:hypothetical protein
MTIDIKCKRHIKYLCSRNEFELFRNILQNLLMFQSNYLPRNQISESALIVKEYEWTDMLMEMVEFGNAYVLSSFQYRIVMED